jgi:hypothetical protein
MSTRRWIARNAGAIALVVLWLILVDLVQSRGTLRSWLWHALPAGVCVLVLIRDARGVDGLPVRIRRAWNGSPIPFWPRVVAAIILVVQCAYITWGVTDYPFADVGMFRSSRRVQDLPSRCVHTAYYFRDSTGVARLVDLRKQHVHFMDDLLGAGYNNEYTFSAAYHYRGTQANHDLLLAALREAGVDTLWVGLQVVDYGTGEVTFDPDPCRAIAYNDTAGQFYGPIHIPAHQRQLCGHGQ